MRLDESVAECAPELPQLSVEKVRGIVHYRSQLTTHPPLCHHLHTVQLAFLTSLFSLWHHRSWCHLPSTLLQRIWCWLPQTGRTFAAAHCTHCTGAAKQTVGALFRWSKAHGRKCWGKKQHRPAPKHNICSIGIYCTNIFLHHPIHPSGTVGISW